MDNQYGGAPRTPPDEERAITVSENGEFGLIRRLVGRMTAIRAPGEPTLLGSGDDAAVVAASDGRVVASTDMLVEGRHFRRDWSSAADVGHRAAAANFADIAAMGAVPTGLLVGFACPADLPLEWAEELADGLAEEAAALNVDVLGGDVVRSDIITIGVTALGDLRGRAPVTRSGARPGDVVALAGRIGYAAAGWLVLKRGFRSPSVVVAAFRRPEPPYAAGPAAADLGATAMCDVSDGLVQDLGHIAEASGVWIDIDPDTLVVPDRLRDVGAALGVDPMGWMLTGGEDHALAATFPAGVRLPEPWTQIGTVGTGSGVTVAGEKYGLEGWDHFR